MRQISTMELILHTIDNLINLRKLLCVPLPISTVVYVSCSMCIRRLLVGWLCVCWETRLAVCVCVGRGAG